MGWCNSHLHEFDIAGLRYVMTDPEWDVDPELINEERKKLLKVLGDQKQFDYLYDFGDSWLHRITLEKRLPVIEQITLDNIIPAIEPQHPGLRCALAVRLAEHEGEHEIIIVRPRGEGVQHRAVGEGAELGPGHHLLVRYLENQIRRRYSYEGSPIKLVFRSRARE